MNTIQADLRKQHEIAHGKFLAPRAVEIWGWGTPAGAERAKRRTQLIIDYAGIRSGKRVLEFGCGTGMFSKEFAMTGATVFGLDLSPDLISEADKQARVQEDHGFRSRLTFSVGDIECLEFPSEHFDAVVGSSVLHHVDYQRALREAFRVLRPGGRVAFAEPNMLNPQIALQKNIPAIKRRLGDSPDETAFFKWSIGRTLLETGFIDVVVIPHDFLHPAISPSFIPIVKKLGSVLEAIPFVREIAGSLLLAGSKPALTL